MSKRKIIYSILKELEAENSEPRAIDYGISIAEFGDIVEMMENDGLIKGSAMSRGGRGNEARIVYLDTAKVTIKGLGYLEENSKWAKTYKGLKEIRDWLPLP